MKLYGNLELVDPAGFNVKQTAAGGGVYTHGVTPADFAFEALSSGDFSPGPTLVGNAQSKAYVLRTVTTTAVLTEMFLDGFGGSQRMVLPDNTLWAAEILIVGKVSPMSAESVALKFETAIYRGVGPGSVFQFGPALKTVIGLNGAQSPVPTWLAGPNADTVNGSLRLLVAGDLGKTVRWVAYVRTVEVEG